MAVAAIFNLRIVIDEENEIKEFSGVTITRSISGLGIDGVSIAQLSFSCPETAVESVPRAAKVQVLGCDGLPAFYINSRSLKNGVYSFTCLDTLAKAGATIDTSRIHFLSNGKILTSNLLAFIAQELGVEYVESPSNCPMYVGRSSVENSTIEAFLEELSKVCVGFWYCTGNIVSFAQYGNPPAEMNVDEYTAIETGLPWICKGVRVINGNDKWEIGNLDYAYDTLEIKSDMADASTAGAIGIAVIDYRFDAITVEKAIAPDNTLPICPSCICRFLTSNGERKAYPITAFKASITREGIMMSMNSAPVGGNEITSKTKLISELESKIRANTRYGAVKISNGSGLGLISNSEAVVNSG